MNTIYKVIIGGTVGVMVGAVTLVTVGRTGPGAFSTLARPITPAFAARFQPSLPVIAEIGSTRDLTPVQLDGVPTRELGAPPQARGGASDERGHHASGRHGR